MPTDSGFDTWKDIIEVFILGIGGVAVTTFIAIWTYRLNRKQFQFAVMISCIERFQQIVSDLEANKMQYIDLCNEELFYFKNKFLPDEVVNEWLDGMIDYLPHITSAENKSNANSLVKIDDLKNYPRIEYAFTVQEQYDLGKSKDRQELIASIRKNNKGYKWP